MPFPWIKKKKMTSRSSRFSQFVANHINTPVVETGFPTSLVDLFVKNRDRMRKSSKKKRETPAALRDPVKLSSLSPSHAPYEPPSNAPNSTPPPSALPTQAAAYLRIEEETEKFTNFRIEKTIVKGPIGPSANVGGCKKFAESGGFGSLISVLMILLAVGLALATKRFVIGITMSAFLLFFLELVGKKRRSRSSSDKPTKIKSALERVPSFDGMKPESPEIQTVKLESRSLPEILSFERSGNSGDCHKESRALPQQISSYEESSNAGDCNEESISLPKEISSSDQESGNSGDCNERLGSDDKVDSKKGVLEKEEEYECEIREIKHRHSRRARMKSKVQKLVPKKLRKSKKIHSNAESEEVSGSTCELVTWEGREQCNVEQDYQEDQQVLSTELDHERHATDSSKESSFVESREVIVEGEMGSQTQCDSGYLILCLIVLFGLVGGRIVALVLALSWCLILKIVERSRKVPMVRSSLS